MTSSEFYKNRIDELEEQLEAVQRQMRTESDYEKQLLLQRKADDLLQQMNELKKLSNTNQIPCNQITLFINNKIKEHDFEKAKKSIERKFKKFDKFWGEAIFLIDNIYDMAGQDCIALIKDKLKDDLNETRKLFRPFPIGITSLSEKNEFGILLPLGEYLKITDDGKGRKNLSEYTQKIIEKICGSLQTGSIIFIQINDWEHFIECQDKILFWFLNDFWSLLIAEGKKTVKNKDWRQVRFVTVINASVKMSFKEHKHLFDKYDVIKIPLGKWNEEDIGMLLAKCCPSLINQDITGSQIDNMAKSIHFRTKGIPLKVRNFLEQDISSLMNISKTSR
jgi:hypothetical protein